MGRIHIDPEDVRKHEGEPMPGPDMTEPEIESRCVRNGLAADEANVCVSVRPGEKLGELYVCIQYEGKSDTGAGEPDMCMRGQNLLLHDVGKALEKLLAEHACEFRVMIDAEPCPKANVAYELEEFARLLDPTFRIEDRDLGNLDERNLEDDRDRTVE